MARNVAFYVSTTNNTVKVVDTDAQGTIVGGATTGFGCWSADMTLLDLTNAQATLKMRNVFGHTVGVFTYAELGAVTINGVDQSGSIANLSQFEAIFAQYLYQDDLSATLSVVTTIANRVNGVILSEDVAFTGSGETDTYDVDGSSMISVQFSTNNTTALATNTVQVHGTIDGITYTMIGSAYSGTGDVSYTLNFNAQTETTIVKKVKLVIVDGSGLDTMSVAARIYAIRG